MMKDHNTPPQRSLAIFVLSFLVLALSVMVTAYGFSHAFAAHVQAQVEGQLTAIATLRIEELSDWRGERIGAEAEILRQNAHFAEDARRFFADPRDQQAREQLLTTLRSYRAHEEYTHVSLLDTTGQLRLIDSGSAALPASAILARIPDVLRTRQVTMVDFYRGADQRSELAILIPIMDPQSARDVIGLVVLQINPEGYLFPYLERWPMPGVSAETLLARREGDGLVALSPLRSAPEAASGAQSPLMAPDLPTILAALDQAEIIAGRDYRGAPVVALVQAVPDSPWLLITKIDTVEGYAPLWEREWQLAVFSAVLIIALGAGLLLLWRQQRLSAIRQQLTMLAALRASEELYHGLMESLDSVVATVDGAGSLLYINRNGARVAGLPPEAMIGKALDELFPGHGAAEQLRHIWRAIRDDTALAYETSVIAKGQSRWYHISVQPIHDETGRTVAALVNATDIHDLKQAQYELQELNRTLEERVRQRTAEVQDLYDRAPTGYHSLDAQGTLIMVNQTALDWLGYTREELIGRPFVNLLTPASQSTFRACFLVFKEQGWLQGVELELARKDGSTFPALISATAVYDEAGAYVMSRSTLLDITERTAAETALRESEAQNRLLFEVSPDALVLLDATGAIVRINYACTDLTGYRAEQLAGQRLAERGMLSERAGAQLSAALEQARHSNASAATEFTLTSADGAPREVGARVFALQIQGAQHYLAALRDITAEKQAAVALRQANLELARAARAKDEFLATMSHELRTPLNAILGFSESLLEEIQGPLTARQQSALTRITDSGQHLLELINDILDLSKVGAGHLKLQIEAVEIAELCQRSLFFINEAAQKKGLRVTLYVQDDLAVVRADPRRLRQMLVNLLANAAKFTPNGGTVGLEALADPAAGGVRFVVRDSGIGIAPEDIGRLFQPFSQLDAGLNRHHEGTGLGLALVLRLAELHGGGVTVESEPGKGSCFTITLPYQPPRAGQAPSAEAMQGLLDR